MRLLMVALVLGLLAVPADAQVRDRCSLEPTLEAYMTRQYGNPERTVWPPVAEDGAACEKLRYDRRAFLCQIARAEGQIESTERTLSGMQNSLERTRAAPVTRFGSMTTGPAAKERAIAGLVRNVAEFDLNLRTARDAADQAGASKLRVEAEMRTAACTLE